MPEVALVRCEVCGAGLENQIAHERAEHRRTIEAVLLWFSASPWDEEKARLWESLTGTTEATTKNLCDALRKKIEEK